MIKSLREDAFPTDEPITRENRFHVRSKYEESDEVRVFSSHYCSEKPSVDHLEGNSSQLHAMRDGFSINDYSLLEPNDRTIHFLRQYAKKGKYPDGSFTVDPRFSANDEIIEDRIIAAKWVVDQLLTDQHVRELAEHIHDSLKGRKDQSVVILRNQVAQGADISYNFLSPTYDQVLIDRLDNYFAENYPEDQVNFEMKTALRLNDTLRVYSGPIGRLARLPFIDLEDLKPKVDGKMILVADEHIQAAGMASTLYSLSKQLGGEVIGVTTLTSHPTTKSLKLSGDVCNMVLEYADKSSQDNMNGSDLLEDTLNSLGLSIETITNREGLYILALLMDGEDDQQFHSFLDLEKKLSGGLQVIEGVEDNVRKVLFDPPLSVQELQEKIQNHIAHRADHFYNPQFSP
tara:strand:+ start:1380 stop:2585 length:1206 start_codon:yes stop_codon:yes gene_type:complete